MTLAVLCLPCLAYPELRQVPFNCDGKTCHHTLPVLQPLKGWHLDRGQNNDIDATVFVPDGYNIDTAEHIIYARALSKPLISDNPLLTHFIAMEKADFAEVYPGVAITEVNPIQSASGNKMRSLVLVPKAKGKWEQVTYSEEGGHFIVVTLSAKTEKAYKSGRGAYYEMLGSYR